jgi:hypothetical protein
VKKDRREREKWKQEAQDPDGRHHVMGVWSIFLNAFVAAQ